MSTFSPSDAAFEGFRIIRREPKAFIAWAIFQLIVSVVVAVSLIVVAGPQLIAVETSGGDSADLRALFSNPIFMLLCLIGLVVQSVMAGAVFRTVLRPGDSGTSHIRFGKDELRLMALTLIYTGLAVACVFVVVLIAAIIAGVLGVFSGQWRALVGVVVGLVAFGVLVWLAVRLSLAAVVTFTEGRLRVFHSWTLTRGHFWRLFGAYVLATVLAFVVVLVALVLISVVAAIATGGDIAAVGAIFQSDTSSLKAYLQPAVVISTILSAVISAFNYAIVFAPPAVAYRDLVATAGEVG